MLILQNSMKNKNLSFFIANLLSWVPDPLMLKLLYRFKLGKKLNLKNPQTFNEKLQWLKLYDRKIQQWWISMQSRSM